MPASSQREHIWQLIAAIPAGKVATYGQIARLSGLPGHARHVGTTLKNLPPDSRLPWHRVINAQGRLSFPTGSEAYLTQKHRLETEGIVFVGERVCLQRQQWDASV
ncbi:MAG: MGMT family protein [Pseudomonadales bacterium]|nr:MGMT family protein [Pseudomonadales bacterium]